MRVFPAFGRQFLRIIGAALLCALAAWLALAQQSSFTNYVYDNNGRLRAVLAPDGQVAVYDYDPAGNITAIRRLTADAYELLAFFPDTGKGGDLVTFRGIGLHSVTAVSFNGVPSRIVSAEATRLVAEVPQAVTTGPVMLNSPRGTLVTPLPFTVRGVVISPRTVSLNPGQKRQFTARVLPDGGDEAVIWSVNGVPGGNSLFGTITTGGEYTAPNALFSMITVRAASVADPGLTDEARVMVGITEDKGSLAGFATSFVSVGREPMPPPPMMAAISVAISVGRQNSSPLAMPAAIAAAIAVGRESQAMPLTPVAASALVSASKAPLITAATPGTVSRGTNNIALTINGRNLSGASAIRFIAANGLADDTLTVTNVVVSGDGTTLTALLSVTAAASPGARLIVVTAPGGSSQVSRTGQNSIEITP